MHNEIQIALEFLVSFLHNKIPKSKVCSFSKHLTNRLLTRFEGHWYPEKPSKGSAFRCITMGKTKIDDVIKLAAEDAGLDSDNLQSTFTSDVSVWVDPEEVSYRIGENGAVKVLFNFSNAQQQQQLPYLNQSQMSSRNGHADEFMDSAIYGYPASTPSPLHHQGDFQNGPYYNNSYFENGFDAETFGDFDVSNNYFTDEMGAVGGKRSNNLLNVAESAQLGAGGGPQRSHHFYSSPTTYYNNHGSNSSEGLVTYLPNMRPPPPSTASPLYFNKQLHHKSQAHQQSSQGGAGNGAGQQSQHYLALTPPPSFQNFHHQHHSQNGGGGFGYNLPFNNHHSGKFMGASKYHHYNQTGHSQPSSTGYYHNGSGHKRAASALNTPFHYNSTFGGKRAGSINYGPKGSASPPFYQNSSPPGTTTNNGPQSHHSAVALGANFRNGPGATNLSSSRRGLTFSPSPTSVPQSFVSMGDEASPPEEMVNGVDYGQQQQQAYPHFYGSGKAYGAGGDYRCKIPSSQTVYFNHTKADDYSNLIPNNSSDSDSANNDVIGYGGGKKCHQNRDFLGDAQDIARIGATSSSISINSNNAPNTHHTNNEAQSQTLSSSYKSSSADEQTPSSNGSYNMRPTNGINVNSLDIITNNLQHLLVAN